jgi:hypothetical protein
MIPIYRAKRLDNGEYIHGFYIDNQIVPINIDNTVAYERSREIDPSTLMISFDGGVKWFDLNRVNEIMGEQVNCKVCKDTGVNHGVQRKPGKWSSEPCESCSINEGASDDK